MLVFAAAAAASGATFLALFPFIIAPALAQVPRAACMVALSDEFTGRSTPIGMCFRIALRRLLTLIVIGFLVAILQSIGFILLIIPGLIIMAVYFVSTQACLFENLGVFAAMERSAKLTKGSRGQVLGVAFVVGLLASVVLIPLGILDYMVTEAGEESAQLVSAMLNIASALISGLIMTCAEVAIYYNQRVKKDSFDVESLTSLVDAIAERGAAESD
jgi:hypothetical protein